MARRDQKKTSSISIDGDDKQISSSVATKKRQVQHTKDASNVAAGPDLKPNNRKPAVHVLGGKNVSVLNPGSGVSDDSLTIKMKAGGQGSDNKTAKLQLKRHHVDPGDRSPKPSLPRSTRHSSRHSHEPRRESIPSSEPHDSNHRRTRPTESLPRSTTHTSRHSHEPRRESFPSSEPHAGNHRRTRPTESLPRSTGHPSRHSHEPRRESLPSSEPHAGNHRRTRPTESLPSSTGHPSRHSHEPRRKSLPSSEPHAGNHGRTRRGERLPSSTRHPIHQHVLQRKLQRETDEKVYICNGCKMPGSGIRYTCKQCSFEFNLHEKCTFTFSGKDRLDTQHYRFRKSIFKILDKLPHRCEGGNCRDCHRFCEACAKPTEGFVYYCEALNICFHPLCFDLGRRGFDLGSKYSTSEYRTEFELCPDQTYSCCFFCKKKQVEGSVTGNAGWTYVSKCKKLSFHVFCSMYRFEDLISVMENPKPPSGNNGNIIFEFLGIFLGLLLGDPIISPTLGFVNLLKALVEVQRRAIL